MTLHEAMPEYDVREYHQTIIRASPEETYRALKVTDFRGSWLVRMLLRMRAGGRAPGRVTLEQFWQSGFVMLWDEPNVEVLLGVVGKFWTPSGRRIEVTPQQFASFDDPRYGKAAFTFQLSQHPSGTLLSTETRVRCFGRKERILFRCYWTLIRPFSGLIRIEMLKQVRHVCERELMK